MKYADLNVFAKQGSGIAQVGSLIGLEFIILLSKTPVNFAKLFSSNIVALLMTWPYDLPYGNAFHIFSALKRLSASLLLLAFWEGFAVQVSTQTASRIFFYPYLNRRSLNEAWAYCLWSSNQSTQWACSQSCCIMAVSRYGSRTTEPTSYFILFICRKGNSEMVQRPPS